MARARASEAMLVETYAGGEYVGLEPQGDGWFVVNIADAAAITTDNAGHAWRFEGEERFPHFGINVHVLMPGQPASLYHAEDGQEAFLILQGECLLIVEDDERRLRQWDLFHAAPQTAHVLVGAGDGPCAILMVGARNAGDALVYPVSALAAGYGASAATETESAAEAYAGAGWSRPVPARRSWPPS